MSCEGTFLPFPCPFRWNLEGELHQGPRTDTGSHYLLNYDSSLPTLRLPPSIFQTLRLYPSPRYLFNTYTSVAHPKGYSFLVRADCSQVNLRTVTQLQTRDCSWYIFGFPPSFQGPSLAQEGSNAIGKIHFS
jgi:hypothetical protein